MTRSQEILYHSNRVLNKPNFQSGDMKKNACMAVYCALTLVFAGFCQEGDKKPEATKVLATELWNKLNAGPVHVVESKKVILAMPKAMEAKARDITASLEKHQDLAMKQMGFTGENPPWNGRILVLVLPEREHFAGFVRRVGKRSPQKDENSSYGYVDGIPHLAVGPPRGKDAFTQEAEAAIKMGGAVLRARAGEKTPLPDWVPDGFGLAVHWRVLGGVNKNVQASRRKVMLASRNVKALSDFWTTADASVAPVLQASLMEYIAFGPHAAKVESFVKAFSPDDNGDSKSPEQAMETATIIPGQVMASWRNWFPAQK